MENINGYTIIKKLGEGGFGETFLAEKNNQRVVIKKLKLSEIDRWKTVERFQREAAVLKALNHPAIPDYIDFIEAENYLGIVQEYVDGESWQQLIESEKRFTPEEIKGFLIQGLEILIYLKKQKMIHRDLNPQNILLDQTGKIWFVDFGSVRSIIAERNSTVTTMGTFGYMAPEQVMGNATLRSDLFSFGMSLIALSNGAGINQLPQNMLDGTLDLTALDPLPITIRETLREMIEPGVEQRIASPKKALQSLRKNRKLQKVNQISLTIKNGIKQYHAPGWWGYVLNEEPDRFVDPGKQSNPVLVLLGFLLSGPGIYLYIKEQPYNLLNYILMALPAYITLVFLIPFMENRINRKCYYKQLDERGRILYLWNGFVVLEQNRVPVWGVPVNSVTKIDLIPLEKDEMLCEIRSDQVDQPLFCHRFKTATAATMVRDGIIDYRKQFQLERS